MSEWKITFFPLHIKAGEYTSFLRLGSITSLPSLALQSKFGPWMLCCILREGCIWELPALCCARHKGSMSVCRSPGYSLSFWVHLLMLDWFVESTAAFLSGAALGKADSFLPPVPPSSCWVLIGDTSEWSSSGSRSLGYCHWFSDSSRGLTVSMYLHLSLPFSPS